MNSLILLFLEFFKIGLFTFGGGFASLPFLYHICEIYSWYSYSELTQMIAVSSLTPGPIGFNMATFAGYNTSGILGSLVSSFALVLPMLIITSFVFRLYKKFHENECVKSVIYVLRPTGCALLGFVGIKLIMSLIISNSDLKGLILLLILFLMTFKFKRNPAPYLFSGAIFGIAVWFIK